MSRRVVLISIAGLLALSSAIASAAGPPLPKPARAYSTGGNTSGGGLTLVTSASSGKRIEAGEAALGSQFAISNGSVLCKKAKKSPTLHQGFPFATFGFPATTLKVTGGKYGFSKTVTVKKTEVLGSESTKPFTLKVKIAGTVLSPAAIAVTITAKGGPCTTKKPLELKAKLEPKSVVAPGQ